MGDASRPELQALGSALGEALSGAPRVVLLEGAPGSGKTALIEALLAQHPDLRVLRASGERVQLGVVDQLVRQGGLAGVSPDPPGPQVLDLLTANAPLIVVVDDAQWADAPSLHALVFAGRRLVSARVLIVVASRFGAPLESVRRLADRRVVMRPASADDLQALGVELSWAAARRLLEHTDGDLRLARALLSELAPGTWCDFERPLPAPRELASEVEERIAACSGDATRLVEAAAVLGSGCRLADAAQLASVEASLAGLEEAVDAELVLTERRRGLPTIEFSPPAVAAAVYGRLGPARAAALHEGAARIVEDEVVALLHRAAAVPGPDDALAEQLDALARRSHDRREAAAALVAASRLSSTHGQREDRLTRAVDWLLLAGDAARARGFAAEIAAFAPAARRDSVLAQLALSGDRVRDAAAWLQSAWEQCDPRREPELAATIAHRTAFHALINLRDDEVVAWAGRALELAPRDPLAVEWNATLALALWRQGRHDEAYAVLDGAPTGDAERDAPLNGMRAWLQIAGDDIGRAREALAAAAAIELRLGAREIGVVHLNVLARAHFAIGAWDEAVAVADQAVALASQLEDVSARVFVWWAAVLVPAARGDWATAEHFAGRAAAEPTDAPDRIVAVAIARALPAASRGQFETVIDALAPVAAITPSAGVDEPGFWPWHSLYGDALVSAARLDEADAFLEPQEHLAAERGHPTAIARLAVVHGRLAAARGQRARADEAFERALDTLQPLERPYETALAQLAAGQARRRDGRRRSAVELLSAAAAGFGALGAQPALERAERELAASGLRPTRRGLEGPGRLTPQEQTVAQLVAAGHSNRDVATHLQLSIKTVEVHLTRIYAKLGIGSRTRLARHLAADKESQGSI